MKKRMSLLLLLCMLFSGCQSAGVPQEEYDKALAEVKELKESISLLETELNSVKESGRKANEEKEKLQEQYSVLENELTSLKEESKMVAEENEELKKSISVLEGELESAKNQSEQGGYAGNKKAGISFVNKESLSGKIEVLKEYTFTSRWGGTTYHFMVVKNGLDQTVDISSSSLAYTEDGNMVGASSANFEALGTGCTSVFYERFDTEEEIAYYETEISFSASRYYESVIQDLSYVQNDIKGGAIFQVSNNGTEAAEFVKGYVLFFLEGELVEYESAYFTDDDSELKPGRTISKQITADEKFDAMEFYLIGRR